MFDPTKYTKSKWLKGSDLKPGRPVTVTVARAYEHRFEQSNETKPALDFSDIDQSLALNKAQVTSMIEAFGPNIQHWIGQRINLLPVPSSFQGKPTILITVAEPTFNGAEAPSF